MHYMNEYFVRTLPRMTSYPVADPGGAPPARAPLQVQILSFWHTNFLKRSHLGSWRPPHEVGAPHGESWIRYCYQMGGFMFMIQKQSRRREEQ